MKSNSLAQQSPASNAEAKVNLRSHLDLGAYEGQWVALSPDRSKVIASGADLKRCDQAVAAAGVSREDVLFHRVPPKGVLFLG